MMDENREEEYMQSFVFESQSVNVVGALMPHAHGFSTSREYKVEML